VKRKNTGRIDERELLAQIAQRDPDVMLAAGEVDRSLIRMCMKMPPLERVRSACLDAEYLSRFYRVEK